MTLAARPRRSLSRLTAALAATVLLLSGCTQLGEGAEDGGGAGDGTSDGGGSAQQAPDGEQDLPLDELGTSAAQDLPGDPSTDPEYAQYYEQDIEWDDCEGVVAEGLECGILTVPLAWDDPGGTDIDLAVARIPGSGQVTGSLVFNPGGPGVSGVNYMESAPYMISPEVLGTYDLVSFDPRGVGRSEGVQCLTDEETDEYRAVKGQPVSAESSRLYEEWGARIAASCEENSGEVLPYLDTYSSARDMDVLRSSLGSEQLDYLGYSYGSYLGSSYADLYPDRVGHFVLDGAIDPTLTMDEFVAGQSEGFEKAADVFLQDCLDTAQQCPLKGDVAEAKKQLNAFFAAADESPVDSGDPERPLTGSLARSAVLALMYSDELWPTGREALTAAMNGDGSQLLEMDDRSAERQLDGSYRTSSAFSMTAVNCLDHPRVADEEWAAQETARIAEEFPTFGSNIAKDDCAQWPQAPVREPAPISAEGAAPIVVIGTTGDPATPYAWSTALAEQLDSGVHLTWEGNGHTAYGRSGGCIEEQVDAYLLADTVPEDGFSC
ncbi:MAG: alpha/beta hydrolase [Brachybacterium tyrofermentans]|uniref:alpha/beta hydrolase n=2 Tax=Brachybacterium tyrofermentans TaxID=47848 RepID=UPI0018675D1C|nr:alpha/beta hydrolase [Brachybacterium tyrofermentans]